MIDVIGCLLCAKFKATPIHGAEKISSEYWNNRIL